MACLWEEIEGLDLGGLVFVFQEAGEIAHLGGGVTGDVDDFTGLVGEELVEEVSAASFSGRVDDDGGLYGGVGDVLEELFGGGGDEDRVGDVVGGGIASCPVCGGFRDFDTGDFLEVLGEGEGEKSGAAVGVEEKALSTAGGLLGDVIGEGGEDEGIVLEEVACEEVEGEVTDFF